MARNNITGDIISIGQAKGDKELYDAGWDRIFGKKTEEPQTWTVLEILADPTHEAYDVLSEMLAKLESGEICFS